jgi:hypothetical protein
VLGKAAKAISRATTHAAQLEAQNQQLQQQLDSIKSTKLRRRTRINPNDRFNEIRAIKAAIAQATLQTAISSTSRAAQVASHAAEAVAISALEDI